MKQVAGFTAKVGGTLLTKEGQGDAVSLALDFAPIVGDIKGVIESFTGKDLITGDNIPAYARVLGAIPLLGGALKRFASAGELIGSVLLGGGAVLLAASKSDEASNVVKALEKLQKAGAPGSFRKVVGEGQESLKRLDPQKGLEELTDNIPIRAEDLPFIETLQERNLREGTGFEGAARIFAREQGESVIRTQFRFGDSTVNQGIEFISFKGVGRNVQTFINEVKDELGAVAPGEFTALGLKTKNRVTGVSDNFERNLRVAVERIRATNLDSVTKDTIIRQVLGLESGATVRIIGSQAKGTKITERTRKLIEESTGLPVIERLI